MKLEKDSDQIRLQFATSTFLQSIWTGGIKRETILFMMFLLLNFVVKLEYKSQRFISAQMQKKCKNRGHLTFIQPYTRMYI